MPPLAPTVDDLLAQPAVQQALHDAWQNSLPADSLLRHEEGGWVYVDIASGAISVRRASAGARALLDLTVPPIVTGAVVVGTFHTHPNPSSEGWNPGPSPADVRSAQLLGVPCIIRSDDGIHTTGPISRRGGLASGPGFPP
jgi:hypothetical protein